MKKHFLFLGLFVQTALVYAQQTFDLQENTPVEYKGLLYGYDITNETTKEVSGEDYARYVINFYVTNKTGGVKVIPFSVLGNDANEDGFVIAEFSCKNATGKRLTSKGGQVKIKPWFTKAKVSDGATPAKYKLVDAQVGFALMSGQTVNEKIIATVPKGQRPQIVCRPAFLMD